VLKQLGDPYAILVIDESSFSQARKKSQQEEAEQHCGTTGQLESCQVGVFLAYVSAKGHTLIDREFVSSLALDPRP